MRKNLKIALAVVIVGAVAGAGGYTAYVLSTPPSPCAASGAALQSPFPRAQPNAQSVSNDPLFRASHDSSPRDAYSDPVSTAPVINVVAAENFWGSLVAQIGGTHVNVTSIVNDPNTDPHDYESNVSTARAFATAQYIVVNNVGYDQWATLLIAADGNSNQTILNVGDSLGVRVGGGVVSGNPHLWYDPAYVNQTVAWMYHNLTTIAPQLSGYFTAQYDNLTVSLASLYAHVGQIRSQFQGTDVAATEDIFVYLANATGLDLVSPPAFMEAVAEGNDPPTSSVVQFQCQLESGQVKILVYNAQTVNPLTQSLKVLAAQHNVTTIFVTETIQPPTATFQEWMLGELDALQNALDAYALGH